MKFKFLPFLVAFVFIITVSNSQTNVSGGVFSNTVWLKANSPYIVTGNVVVFPGVQLTIQPGVKIKFANNTSMEVRGTLMAQGVSNDSIVFTSSSSSPVMNIWRGVHINNTVGGAAYFNYCLFEYAYQAVDNECCWNGGPLTISNSTFKKNFTAVGGYAGWVVPIDGCVFENNKYTITNADKQINNSKFISNYRGIGDTAGVERTLVRNSTFCGNDIGIDLHFSDTLRNCVFTNNKIGYRTIISNNPGGFQFVNNNYFTDNDTGIVTSSNWETYSNNVICNKLMNFVYLDNANKNMANTCWCTTFTSVIAAKIFDAYDNVNYGIVNYSPIVNCDTTAKPLVINCTRSGIPNSSIFNPLPPRVLIDVYPNPSNGQITVKQSDGLNFANKIELFNSLGQLVFSKELNSVEQTIITNLPSGIYFYTTINSTGLSHRNKLIIK